MINSLYGYIAAQVAVMKCPNNCCFKGGMKMSFWAHVKKDLDKGVKESMEVVGASASRFREKTGKLTEEARKRMKIYELKQKVRNELSDLGGHVYDLKEKIKEPLHDEKVKVAMSKIKKLEDQIIELEGKAKEGVKKVISKTSSRWQ